MVAVEVTHSIIFGAQWGYEWEHVISTTEPAGDPATGRLLISQFAPTLIWHLFLYDCFFFLISMHTENHAACQQLIMTPSLK